MVWRIEAGRADELTLRQIDSVVRALSARLDLHVSWQGEGLDRLLDADHAALVDSVAAELRALGWDVVVESTFNIRGERGSIDVLGFHPPSGTVVVIEVKSVVPDLQATMTVLDRRRVSRETSRDDTGGRFAVLAGCSSWPTGGPPGVALRLTKPPFFHPRFLSGLSPRVGGSDLRTRVGRYRGSGFCRMHAG